MNIRDKKFLPHVESEYSIIASTFFPNVELPGKTLELIVNTTISGASLRDATAYLTLLDRTYGRMFPLGLRSYSRRLDDQLKVTEVRHGSLELVFAEILKNSSQATPLIMLFLLLKYLPQLLKAVSEAYLNYEKARVIHERRKESENKNVSSRVSSEQAKGLETDSRKRIAESTREAISHEPNLKDATEETKNIILQAFEEFAQHDHSLHQAAERFSVEYVKEIKIRLVPTSGGDIKSYHRHKQTIKKGEKEKAKEEEKEEEEVEQYVLVKSS